VPVRGEGLEQLRDGLLELVVPVRHHVESDPDLAALVGARDEGLENLVAVVLAQVLSLLVARVPVQPLAAALLDLTVKMALDRGAVQYCLYTNPSKFPAYPKGVLLEPRISL
jgi:hypothetical protein